MSPPLPISEDASTVRQPFPLNGPPLLVEGIHTLEELDALRPEWSALYDGCPTATPFQSPEWLLPWWRHIGRGRLWTLTVRADGRLVGLAPLYVSRYQGLPLRRVALLGTGNSDYLEPLAAPEYAGSVWRGVIDHLAAGVDRWDFCDLQQLRAPPALSIPPQRGGAGGPEAAAPSPESSSSRVGSELLGQEVCPVLPLPPTLEALERLLPSRMRGNLRYYRRRLATSHPDACSETATSEALPEFLDALFRLHQSRWNARCLPGSFYSAPVRAFHRDAAAGLLERGVLRMHGLRVGGGLVAVLYCLVAGGRAYYYSGGFAAEVARFSPGSLLIAHAMEDAIRLGAREFDFLRGGETYKYRWGAFDRQNYRLLLWRQSVRGSAALHLNGWERRVEHAAKCLAEPLKAGADRRRQVPTPERPNL